MRSTGLARISLGLAAVTCALFLSLDLVGLLPRADENIARERIRVCEAVALQAATALERADYGTLRDSLTLAVGRNEDVLSAAYRDANGRLIASTRGHVRFWQPKKPEGSTVTHVRIPLVSKERSRGALEVRFTAITTSSAALDYLNQPVIHILLATISFGFMAYFLYMRRTLRFLDPGAVIPPRVQTALDIMAEGVLLVDNHENVLLANSAFADFMGVKSSALIGSRISDLPWKVPRSDEALREFPWAPTIGESAEPIRGVPLALGNSRGDRFTLMVSASPVMDGAGSSQGAIVTFDDVSELERRSEELQQALTALEKSRDEVRLQNEELQVLASCDPLTGVSNRRTYLTKLGEDLARAREDAADLCCLMVDIDHFKLVNDNHGHSVGDAVIVSMAHALTDAVIDRERVCRYGGEEFCITLWGSSVEEAMEIADQIRQRVAADGFSEVPITASFGVASIRGAAQTPHDLINRADEALYFSKENGRNRVTFRGDMPDER